MRDSVDTRVAPGPTDILPPGDYAATDPNWQANATSSLTASERNRPEAYTHPWYDARFEDWEFYRTSYEGGKEYLWKNLWRHPQERTINYDRRLERAVHLNHVRVVVDTYAGHLYRKPFHRDLDEVDESRTALLQGIQADIDRKGTNAQNFFRKVFRRGFALGYQGIVVDRWDPPGEMPRSRADQEARGVRPYAYSVDPQDMIHWHMDEEGDLEWIVIREYHTPDVGFMRAAAKPKERFRVWSKTDWKLYEVEKTDAASRVNPEDKYRYRLISEGQHPCGRVPVVMCYIGERIEDMPMAESPMRDIAPLVRQLSNKVSLIDEQIYQHVFNILVAPEGMAEALAKVDWSVAGVLGQPEECEFAPRYLAPDVTQLKTIRDEVREIEMAIRFLSGLGRLNETARVYVSDTSLSFQTIDKRALLENLGNKMAETEQDVYRLACAWQGLDESDIPLPGFEIDLEPGEIEQALSDGLRLMALGVPQDSEAALETMIQASRAHLGGNVDPARMEAIIDDLRQRWATMSKNEPSSLFAQVST